MTITRSVVLGCGSYLPSRVLTNSELSRMVDTSDEWIAQRTGIRERHIAADGETTSDMGLAAARAALAACRRGRAVDRPDRAGDLHARQHLSRQRGPIQAGLGITHGAAFDLQAVCSGFVFGLATADGLVRTGAFKRALVIGSETFSRILDWNDRATCVLFGDGAGAVVLEAQPQPGTRTDRGVLTSHLRSDGRHKAKLYVDGGPSSTQTVGHLRMEGREVFKHAVAMITDVIEDAFKATGYTAADIDWFVPAPGQPAHHRRQCQEARHRPGKGGQHRRQARQHLGGLDPAGADRGGSGWPHQTWRSGDAGGHGRGLHLGVGPGEVVKTAHNLPHTPR